MKTGGGREGRGGSRLMSDLMARTIRHCGRTRSTRTRHPPRGRGARDTGSPWADSLRVTAASPGLEGGGAMCEARWGHRGTHLLGTSAERERGGAVGAPTCRGRILECSGRRARARRGSMRSWATARCGRRLPPAVDRSRDPDGSGAGLQVLRGGRARAGTRGRREDRSRVRERGRLLFS